MAPILQARQNYYCNGGYVNSSYDCGYYNSGWNTYGRWILLVAIIVAAFLFYLIFSCMSARRRRRQGLQPYRFTGWSGQNNYQSGAAPTQYNPPVQPYGNNQSYYNNNNNVTPANNAPPSYAPPKEGNYYGNGGANQGYFGGQQSGIELQQPGNSYQPQREGENVYSAPEGPPPGKGDGIIR